MDTLAFIVGLMKQNTDALGFIPLSTLLDRYIDQQHFILATKAGNPVGYLLHGQPSPGGLLTIAQHCIEYDYRERGYGMNAVRELIERAKQGNCRAISLHCAEDLQANAFWAAAGFERTGVLQKVNRRRRRINIYTLDLWPTLFRLA